MPSTSNFPFRRIDVDHLVEGATTVWWQLDADFNDPGPYAFQLQTGQGGTPTAADWIDAGPAVADTFFAVDATRRTFGKILTTHYRVVLRTSIGVYTSNPVDVLGELDERSWLVGREIIRKEMLRHQYVSNSGMLLKMRRSGRASTKGVDDLTGMVTDSNHPDHMGTGVAGGYYPALPLQCWGFELVNVDEVTRIADQPGPHQPTQVSARILGFPQVLTDDIWVDAKSDERWRVDRVMPKAAIRRVPLVVEVMLSLLPFSNVAYRIPVGGEEGDAAREALPTAGDGCVPIDHDYGGEDALAYVGPDGCGVAGATILAFTAADWTAGLRTASRAVASASTGPDGRWQFALMLAPGDYVLQFEKVGEYGPDTVAITAVAPPADPQSSVSVPGFTFGPI